ncbi:MAG: peptide ABC transporter ATP-binding protein [SAR324 cluster bacterium]|uniref:Peptide ABC transporter ATP-binding protein n=1 Tax=SAR324 cluster bacterium TaxID=2024889 RepID=A0A2A4SS16_9DELT|nr:MAG: peptide ABC transporter ATP-binding protein [SAR324 cluster bacterium]
MAQEKKNNKAQSPLLEVKGVEVAFFLRQGVARAINHIDLIINKGETLGIVGESGCGKSVTAAAIMRLIEEPGKILNGEILLEGVDLLKLSNREMRHIRGNSMAMIFQDPMSGLNPVLSIGKQMCETLILHKGMKKRQALERAEFMLREVGMPNPGDQLKRFPHELSGGMRQRVLIAMALSCEPKLLIADEPTTALDVTIQAQILELMRELQKKYDMAMLMITHDLGVIAEIADKVAVMYAGDVVEQTTVADLFDNPRHPYTKGLMKAIPTMEDKFSKEDRLYNIPGMVPTLLELPPGCRFQTRCPLATKECTLKNPDLLNHEGHLVRCIHA